MDNMKDFKYIDVEGNQVPFWLKLFGWFVLWLVIAIAISSLFNMFRSVHTFGGLEMLLSLIAVGYIYYKFRYKRQSKANKQIEENLLYFIRSNGLFTTKYVEDVNGQKVEEVDDYVSIGYMITDDELIIRYMIDGSKFDGKAEDFEKSLSGLFGLKLLNKKVKISWVDYHFALVDDERLEVSKSSELKKSEYSDEFPDEISNEVLNEVLGNVDNELGVIDLNGAVRWDYSKTPHALVAGSTGGGKTFFINYLFLEFLKDKATIFACDPKSSDLYALKRVMPEKRIGSSPNQIAMIMRKVSEIMEARYRRFIDGEEFRYGYDYLDYGLNPVVVFFDEIGGFKAGANKEQMNEVYDYMTSIILKGRQMGVFMVLSTQQPNAENIPTQIRDQVGMRVSLGHMSNEGYRMIFGESYEMKSVEGKGTGYLLIDGLGWEKPRDFEAPFINKKEIDIMEEVSKLQDRISSEEEVTEKSSNG